MRGDRLRKCVPVNVVHVALVVVPWHREAIDLEQGGGVVPTFLLCVASRNYLRQIILISGSEGVVISIRNSCLVFGQLPPHTDY